jgi:glycerol-3-phosphate dehydrogenase
MKAIDITGTGLSRKEADNPFNYSDDDNAKKKLALKTMKELWPEVPDMYASWVYDMCVNTPEDKLKEIMKKTDEEPSRFRGLEDVKRLIKEQEEKNSVLE